MCNKFKDINIKNRTYYFFDDMINKKILIQTKINIDEKSNRNALIYHIGYVMVKNLS